MKAEELLKNNYLLIENNKTCEAHTHLVVKQMIAFAKYHVELALKKAYEKAKIIDDPNSYTGNTGSEYPPDQIISKESILKSYDLTNIK